MSFISAFYLLFLGFSLTVYYLLNAKFRPFWLLLISYFFYFTWQPAFLFVLIGETFAAFLLGKKINSVTEVKKKKRWLILSCCVLLLPLVFFKYYNFLNDNLSQLLAIFSSENPLSKQPYLVPLGISFFTFHAIGYVADIYRSYLKPEKGIVNFMVYMCFFPYILAGPIERAKSILGQISSPVSLDYQNIRAGLQLILWGVFKKVVIADRIRDFMSRVYADPGDFHGIFIYFALVFSVFQLFCDFSAYSDIATGSARLFGINLTKNFDDRVYASPSRAIFWQGWHISLTSWLRDYVFFPLSRSVRKQIHLYFNLVFVYLLVGFWHGATWGFIIWGLINGVWLVFERITMKFRQEKFTKLGFDIEGKYYNFLGWLFVFHLGALIGVFFRNDNPTEAFVFLGNILNSSDNLFSQWDTQNCILIIVLLLLMDIINRKIPKNANFDTFICNQKTWLRWVIYIVLSEFILRYLHVFEDLGFIYYNY